MKARDYLNRIRVLNARIDNLIHEKEEIRLSFLPGGASYQEKVQSFPDADRYAEWVSRMDEKESEIRREIDWLCDIRTEITQKINSLQDERYIRVLYLEYVQMKSIRDSANEMGYSERHIQCLRREAIRSFAKKYKMSI